MIQVFELVKKEHNLRYKGSLQIIETLLIPQTKLIDDVHTDSDAETLILEYFLYPKRSWSVL